MFSSCALVEKRFTNSDITRVLSSIEQLKNRLNVIERWNVSYIYDRLQKLHIEFNQIKPNALSAEVRIIRILFLHFIPNIHLDIYDS